MNPVILVCTVGLMIPAAPTLARTPNVVILFADDLGNGDVSCFGASGIRTANIDALAAGGVRLTNFYVAAPICAPSRAALLTGRHPIRIGMSTTKNVSSDEGAAGLPPDEVTLAELAKSRGYATALFGKWHLGSADDATPNAQGFDQFFGHHASCIDPFSHWYYASEPWHHDLYHNRDEVFESGEHMTDLITRETLRFIDAHREEPFLIYVSYNTPHYPMAAQPRFMNALADVPSPRREHASLVLGVDDSVGQIVAKLRQAGLLEDTFVFFTSDNGVPDPSPRGEGGGSNAPYREYKRSLFDGGIHMPAIVSWPGSVPAGEDRPQLTIAMDLFATAAELMDADLPTGRTLDGQSWMPFLRDPAAPGHETLCFEWDGQFAVRQGRWKLVQNGLIDQQRGRNNRAKGESAVFLADVDRDPGEQTNLRAEHPDVADRLLSLHEAWRAEVRRKTAAAPSGL